VSRRNCLALAATTALLAFATAPAAAAATATASSNPGFTATVTTTISGVPAHLAIDDTFEPILTIKSGSADSIEVLDVCLGMWNLEQGGFSQTRGITVAWQDPSSGGWVDSSNIDSNGEWTLDRSDGITTIPPYGTGTVRVRVTMSGAAKRGTEHIDANGVCAYALFDSSGASVPGLLDYNFPQKSFSYGATNSVFSPPTDQATYSYSPAPAPVQTTAAVVAQPPSTAPAVAPSPSPSPSMEQTSATPSAAPVAPSPTGSKFALNATGGDSNGSRMDAVPLTVTAAALLTFAGAAIVIHRRRGAGDPSGDNGEQTGRDK
jgi:hypothetical protein